MNFTVEVTLRSPVIKANTLSEAKDIVMQMLTNSQTRDLTNFAFVEMTCIELEDIDG